MTNHTTTEALGHVHSYLPSLLGVWLRQGVQVLVAGACLTIGPANAQDAAPAVTAPAPASAAEAASEKEGVKAPAPENGSTVKSEVKEGEAAPAPVEPPAAAAPAPAAPAPAAAAPAVLQPLVVEPTWVIGIYPAYPEGEVVTASHTVVEPTNVSATNGPTMIYPCPTARMSYKDAYDQIPFSRAEYEANPGYRHDAAMELVFGAQRPTTIVKQNMPYFSRYPDFQRNRLQVYPYPSAMPSQFNVNHHFFQQWYW
jgi:hypothetical protein